MTAADIWLFFVLPFVIMFVAMLAQIAIRSKSYAGEIPWDDTQREAYIAAVIAAFVTVVVTVIIGGPEVFVLFWRPLITTVIVLPIGFAAALFVFALWRVIKK
jgi:hypothetical protein